MAVRAANILGFSVKRSSEQPATPCPKLAIADMVADLPESTQMTLFRRQPSTFVALQNGHSPGEVAGSFGQSGLSPRIGEGLEYDRIKLGIPCGTSNREGGFALQYCLRHSLGIIGSAETGERGRQNRTRKTIDRIGIDYVLRRFRSVIVPLAVKIGDRQCVVCALRPLPALGEGGGRDRC